MTVVLLRDEVRADCIRGTLLVPTDDGYREFATIERSWQDNARNRSCIPQGEYDVDKMARSASGKYRDVFHVQDVDGRSGILIHNGNLARHSLGCIIVGKKKGMLGGLPAVLSSKPALREMNRLLDDSFRLVVIGGY